MALVEGKPPPQRIKDLWDLVLSGADCELRLLHAPVIASELEGPSSWDLCKALLELHAVADATCVGVGLPDGIAPNDLIWSERMKFVLHANDLLRPTTNAALNAIVPANQVRVLPKMRTAQVGITVRSLSLHLSAETSSIPTTWLFTPTGRNIERLNLLLVPWPFEVNASDFRPVPDSNVHMDNESFGFFGFEPSTKLSLVASVEAAIQSAKAHVGDVHGVVFPEQAVDESELRLLEELLARENIHFLLAGVRDADTNLARLTAFGALEPVRVDQHKHHRWCVDGAQIRNYRLGFQMLPTRRWWEAVQVAPRSISFFQVNSWLTMCHLICEDLARVEPVSRMIRCVGPNLVVALLLDGPQLKQRWPSRYATVLADDPGSSVLTLTSLGMALRSRPPGTEAKRTIGLWTDPVNGTRELELGPKANAMIIGIHPEWATEWSADGRSDHGAAARPVLHETIELEV